MTTQRLISRFLEMMQAERGAARNSILAYGRDLEDYAAFLARQGREARTAGSDDVRGYLADLEVRGMARSSTARKLSAVKQFHLFMQGEGYAPQNPATIVEGPKKRAVLPKTLQDDDVTRLLAAAADAVSAAKPQHRFRAARMQCLVELLAATGLRVSELVSLKLAAVRSESDFLTIKGKGGRERMVPVSKRAQAVLRDYVSLLKLQFEKPPEWLFPSHGESGALTRQHFASGIEGAGPQWPESMQSGCHHTFCDMLSLQACWPMARICARCSRCWAMPTFPPHKSTPMCRPNACLRLLSNITPWPNASERHVDFQGS